MASSSQLPASKGRISMSSTPLTTGAGTAEHEPTPWYYPPAHHHLFAQDLYTHISPTAYLTAIPSGRPPITLPRPKPQVQHFPSAAYETTPHLDDDDDLVTRHANNSCSARKSIEDDEHAAWRGEDDVDVWTWTGYVKHPESRERSSLRREAERARVEREKRR